MAKRKPKKAKDVVGPVPKPIPVGTWVIWNSKYGKVVGLKQHYRTLTMRDEVLHNVRPCQPIDGRLMHCPDTRCPTHYDRSAVAFECPICGANLWVGGGEGLRALTKDELSEFVRCGMIKEEL